MSFCINYFSLIIFCRSVWLGFELFTLRIQVYSQLMQFTLVRKGYDSHRCHNKPQTGKRGWSVDDVKEEMVLRIWVFWKRELRVRTWDWTMESSSWGFSHWVRGVEFFGSLPAEKNWDLKHHEMCRTLGVGLALYDYERLLRIVSLFSCRRTEVKKFISRSYMNNRIGLYLHMYMYPCYDWSHHGMQRIYLSIYLSIYQRGAYDKFPDFFRMSI